MVFGVICLRKRINIMERSGRGRVRGGAGRGGTRSGSPQGRGAHGGVRGRGVRGRGVRTRGGGRSNNRPTSSDIFVGTLNDLQVASGPMEQPLNKKRRREPISHRPAGYVKCGGTPRSGTPQSGILRLSTSRQGSPQPGPSRVFNTPRQGSPQVDRSRVWKRPTASGDAPISKRCLIGPSTSSSPIGSKRPLRDDEIEKMLCYGSEEDEDDDDSDDEVGPMPILVPRHARVFLMADVEDELEDQREANVCLTWPPLLPRSLPTTPPGTQPLPRTPPLPGTSPAVSNVTELTATMEPSDKYKFVWKGFPSTQTPPHLRREQFSDIDCGPTLQFTSPCEAFTSIWDRKIMEHIAAETNRYAQQTAFIMLQEGTMQPNSRITTWRDTDADELYVFFAIIIATGIVVKSRLEEYWCSEKDIFITPGFSAAMSYNRYNLLSKCLHFNDNSRISEEMTRAQAKLFKLQPILDHLNNKFSSLYNVSQNIALDESLTMWKGWLDINQFIRNKAASIGIKTYEVCESRTGYLWRFEVHVGHEPPQEDSPISGFIPSLVLRLLEGLEHKGHTVWTDNFYNSPALARELKVRGFDLAGTIRTNRQFVPTELATLTKNDMALGQVCGCTSGDVDLVVWRDKNRVALISTYHGLATVICDGTPKPSIIADYNVFMGGVDLKDSKIAMYPIERRRTKIWYKKFFRRLLNVSVLNSYIMFKAQHNMSHRRFRLNLVKQLMARHQPAPPPSREATPGHFPAQYPIGSGKKRNTSVKVAQFAKHAPCATAVSVMCPCVSSRVLDSTTEVI